MKNCKYTSKLRLWMEFCNEFFGGEWYWCTSNKFKTILKCIIFGWKFIQKMFFFALINQ